MSDNTKQILAITLGTLGLVIGVLAAVVAYNARDAANSDTEVTKLVNERFAEAQVRQDRLEQKQASDAEKLVASLNKGERNAVQRINANRKSLARLRNSTSALQSQVNSLENENRDLVNQLNNLQTQVQRNFNTLNSRIDKTNQRINNLAGG
jgi:predicted  nucleic acid-binding Zn-ribbon protein